VSGCDTGMGSVIAFQLAGLGSVVFAGVLSQKAGEHLVDKFQRQKKNGAGELRPIILDVTKDDDVAAAVRTVQESGIELRAIVCNAGISAFGYVEMLPLSRFQANMDVNHFGIVRMCKAFLPMIRATRGRIVNIGSFGGRVPMSFGAAYLSSKAAMTSFTESLRMEVHRFGVRVSLVEPGFFATGLLTRASANGEKEASLMASDPALAGKYPTYVARMGKTSDLITMIERINGGEHGVERIASCVVDGITNRMPLASYVVGYDRIIRDVAMWLPGWIFDWVETLQL